MKAIVLNYISLGNITWWATFGTIFDMAPTFVKDNQIGRNLKIRNEFKCCLFSVRLIHHL